MKPLLLAILLLVAATPAVAQDETGGLAHPGPIQFEHLDLRMTQAMDMLQDRHGYMWFGHFSQGELFRYDGATLKDYVHDPTDSLSIGPGAIYALFEDEAGELWIGKQRSGLQRFDAATETFETWLHDEGDPTSLSAGGVTDITEMDGDLWVATEAAVSRMDRETGTFRRYDVFPVEDLPGPSPVRRGPVSVLLADSRGGVWAGGAGLAYLAPGAERFEILDTDLAAVQDLYLDESGQVWVGALEGLYRINPETGSAEIVQTSDGPIEMRVRTIEGDPEGGLWLGTVGNGLQWLDTGTGNLAAYEHDPLVPSSLSGDFILDIYRDRQDIMWVSAWWEDVDRFDRAARPFVFYGQRHGGEGGFLHRHVTDISEAPDGRFWVLTNDNSGTSALSLMDPETNQYDHFQVGEGMRLAFPYIQADIDGSVWYVADALDGSWVLGHLTPGSPPRYRFFDDRAGPGRLKPGVPFLDAQERLWLAVPDTGFMRVDDRAAGRGTSFPIDSYVHADYVFVDAEGHFWASANRGRLVRFNPVDGSYDSYATSDNYATYGIAISPTEPGVVWLGMYGAGLGRLDTSDGSFRILGAAEGLEDPGAQGVLADEIGGIWVSTDKGLSRFDIATETFTNYGVDDGLQPSSFSAWSYHKGPSGKMYFGGTRGLNAFFPEEIRDNPHPPEVALTELRLERERVTPGDGGPLSAPLADTDRLVLDADQNDLTLGFAGLHFRHPEMNVQRWMLEGYDDTWSEPTTLRQASYTNLPPGDYTFRVTAANSDGVWSEGGASLEIRILPPWYRTIWAYAFYVLLLGAGIFSVDRYQRARLIRREREAARERELGQAREIERQHTELQKTHQSLKNTQAQLVQSEKLASLGQLTSGIAHELKNPLNFVNNFAEMNEELASELKAIIASSRDRTVSEVEEDLVDLAAGIKTNAGQIAKHGKRADAIVASMMSHATVGSSERLSVDVNDFVEEYVRIATSARAARGSAMPPEVVRRFDDDAGSVRMAPQELGRVLVNLLDNAFDAVAGVEGARLTVATSRIDGKVAITVSDNGPGIPEDVRTKIFEPFFTTKPTGEGTGLGLSLAHDIVTQGHGGRLTVDVSEEGGAAFTLVLPG